MPEHDDIAAVRELNEAYRLITDQLGRVIVGQQQVIEELLVAMFARGHCLLVGVPGLAKTLMIRTLADTLSLEFRRIQFTPDLMPADITGTEVIQEDRKLGLRELRFLKGPIFGNVILADEINRTPPKTRRPCWKPCKNTRLPSAGSGIRSVSRSSCWPRRTRSSTKHVSAARGPTRPLHVQHVRRLSGRGGRVRYRAPHDSRRDGRRDADPFGRGDFAVAEDRPPRAGGRSRGPLCHEVGAF